MADDIDDLLDEVETKFCPTEKRKQTATKHIPKVSKCSKPRNKEDEDLNAIIDDIMDGPEPLAEGIMHNNPWSGTTNGVNGNPPTKKCFPVYLGGSMCKTGIATAMNQRSCDRLRCTDCDFNVSAFDNFQWHSSTDYLFLRNNMPDFPKLRPKLMKKKDYRAYACQCKWRTIRELTNIQHDQELNLKWVCGKH